METEKARERGWEEREMRERMENGDREKIEEEIIGGKGDERGELGRMETGRGEGGGAWRWWLFRWGRGDRGVSLDGSVSFFTRTVFAS